MLTQPSEDAKELTHIYSGRFTGDPSNVTEVTRYQILNEDTEEETAEEQKVNHRSRLEETNDFLKAQLQEEERLAATLWKIEQDALVIPRGSYVLQPNGNVERNRTFEGQLDIWLTMFDLDIFY